MPSPASLGIALPEDAYPGPPTPGRIGARYTGARIGAHDARHFADVSEWQALGHLGKNSIQLGTSHLEQPARGAANKIASNIHINLRMGSLPKVQSTCEIRTLAGLNYDGAIRK